MKRIATFIICALLFVSYAFAEDYDLEGMDFDSLQALKEAVDFEYYSREGAKGIRLAEGTYEVGVDMKPGRYYVKVVEPSKYAPVLAIYDTEEQFTLNRYYNAYYFEYTTIDDEQVSIELKDKNYIWIHDGAMIFSKTPINSDDYYTFNVPEGTFVPAGAYIVGEDIPVGKYSVYAGTQFDGRICIYFTEANYKADGSWHLKADKSYSIDSYKNDSITVTLEEGNIIYVEKDVVMKKQAKLSFD